MLIREKIEERERVQLARWAARSAATRSRVHDEPEHPQRAAYQRDRDRIIHCTAFRRLEYKTQVFVNHEGDHYRTRLTHTLEVAQIGRSIARTLGLNEDLTEAVALAHDLGHPPFGHSGEETLASLMADHGGFEHNLQALRVIDILESRYPNFRGLNLTWEVRESIVKHETAYDHPDARGFEPETSPLLEAQIIDLADSIAYDNHDLDDGLKAGMFTLEDLDEVELWREAAAAVRERFGELSGRMKRIQTVNYLINLRVSDLVRATLANLEAHGIDSAEAVRAHPGRLAAFSEQMRARNQVLQEFLMSRMYKQFRVCRMERKAERFLRQLFGEYTSCPAQLPVKWQEWVREVGVARGACDYVAGMTDRYAQQEYQRLFEPFVTV